MHIIVIILVPCLEKQEKSNIDILWVGVDRTMTRWPCLTSLSSAPALQASRKWQLNETFCAAIGAFQ